MRGISKLVATVVLVGVSLAISVGLALYYAGIVGQSTIIERLDIIHGYANIVIDKFDPTKPPIYRVTLIVINRGEKEVTIDRILINSQPLSSYGADANLSAPTQLPIHIREGEQITIYLNLSTTRFSHGQMVLIELHSASGNRYMKTITLP